MAIQYQVQARVVDLRSDQPRASDRFYVDTNAWFWTVYSNLQYAPSAPNQQRVAAYAAFLQRCIRTGASLFWCGLSLSELAHLIEKTEFEIFKQAAVPPPPLPATIKEYRHGFTAERARVVQEIQASWQAVESMANPIPSGAVIDAAATTDVLGSLATTALDGYDLFSLRALRESGIDQTISDDGDFSLVPGITLFTANRNVIQCAAALGRLIVR